MPVSSELDIKDNFECRTSKKGVIDIRCSNQETQINEVGDLIMVYLYCNTGNLLA